MKQYALTNAFAVLGSWVIYSERIVRFCAVPHGHVTGIKRIRNALEKERPVYQISLPSAHVQTPIPMLSVRVQHAATVHASSFLACGCKATRGPSKAPSCMDAVNCAMSSLGDSFTSSCPKSTETLKSSNRCLSTEKRSSLCGQRRDRARQQQSSHGRVCSWRLRCVLFA